MIPLALADLRKIPPLTKKQVMESWDDICCDKNISLKIAEQHLEDYRNNKTDNPFYKNNYYFSAMSGSSGLRGLFVLDIENFIISGCCAFRYQYIDEGKNHNRGKAKKACITAPTLIHGSKPFFTIRIYQDEDVIHISADTPINEMCRMLEEYQPTHLLGFASVIYELSLQALNNNLQIHPQRVSTNSEPLDEESRSAIRRAWGVEVNNMWGSVEIMVSSVEDDRHIGMILSEDNCIFEAVNDNLEVCDDPEQATKLIVTNLGNKTMPLIRYVIDDTIIISEHPDTAFKVIKEIKGRADDWFCYGDVRIHPMVFRHVLGQEKDIGEYQVKQTKKGADIILVAGREFDAEHIKIKLLEAMKNAGVEAAEISISIVDKLNRYLETGKLKRFVPLR